MRKTLISQIKGFEEFDMFELYEDGTIISHKRNLPVVIKGYDNGKGYLTVDLSYKHKRGVKIHRLVALAFVPNPNNKPQVNHIDGNKRNNEANNLEWVTNAENQLHANKLGLRCYKYKDTKEHKHILQYSLDGEFIAEYKSMRDLCLNVFNRPSSPERGNIYAAINGRNRMKSAYGYKWTFKRSDKIGCNNTN